ncbi:MAG: hypothetical protein LBL49_05735 [Clostridiales Family XIII bacterium]|jgi:hypothetical protein|nr:hypothetical protein [Clostridiales Family XIII bacterium]
MTGRICKSCGADLHEGAEACPVCGTSAIGLYAAEAYEDQASSQNRRRGGETQKRDHRDKRADLPRDIYDESLYQDHRLVPVSASSFIGYYLLFFIPIIGFIAAIIWSVSKNGPINRRNFARATLVLMLFSSIIIAIAGYVILIVLKDLGLYLF